MPQLKRIPPQKIKELQARRLPIEYSYLSVNSQGKLCERKAKDGTSLLDKRVVEGYGVIWGSINSHGERFVKGCFSKSIKELGPDSTSEYKLKFRDRHGNTCGLFEEIKEDDIGLYFRTVPLDDVQWATDVITQLRSGSLNNFSIGFNHIWDKVEWDEENDCMVIIEACLYEISVVDIPSDKKTYAIRTVEREYLIEDVEDFINRLPKSKKLEARKLFSLCMTLEKEEPEQTKPVHSENRSRQNKPVKKAIDWKAIAKQL